MLGQWGGTEQGGRTSVRVPPTFAALSPFSGEQSERDSATAYRKCFLPFLHGAQLLCCCSRWGAVLMEVQGVDCLVTLHPEEHRSGPELQLVQIFLFLFTVSSGTHSC